MGERRCAFHLQSSNFHLSIGPFRPRRLGKPAGALIVSVGSGLARSRLALAAGGRSYSIRRFGGSKFIEQFLFRAKHLSSALLHRISKSVVVPFLVHCPNPEPMRLEPKCERCYGLTPLPYPLTNVELLAVWPNRAPSISALTCSETTNPSRSRGDNKGPSRDLRVFPPETGTVLTVASRPLRPRFCVSKYFPM